MLGQTLGWTLRLQALLWPNLTDLVTGNLTSEERLREFERCTCSYSFNVDSLDPPSPFRGQHPGWFFKHLFAYFAASVIGAEAQILN